MGEWKDKVEGKTKEAVGSVTGDDEKELEGKRQSTWGSVQGAAKDVKDTVESTVDKLRGDLRDDPAGAGDKKHDENDTTTV
jgi:uncharacterized protein YjbJ (UPF0337 family)